MGAILPTIFFSFRISNLPISKTEKPIPNGRDRIPPSTYTEPRTSTAKKNFKSSNFKK
jgi:hypothetical protein